MFVVETSVPQQIEFVIKPQEETAMEVEPSEIDEESVVPEVIERPKVYF